VPYKNHFDAYLAVLCKSTNDLQTRSFAMAQRYGHGSKKSILRHQINPFFFRHRGIFGNQFCPCPSALAAETRPRNNPHHEAAVAKVLLAIKIHLVLGAKTVFWDGKKWLFFWGSKTPRFLDEKP